MIVRTPGVGLLSLCLLFPFSDNALAATVTVNVPELPEGKTVKVRFQAKVANTLPAGAHNVSNQGTVTWATSSSTLTDDPGTGAANDATLTPINAAPDLYISKSDGATVAVRGTTVVYALSVANMGLQGATGVVISDPVPAGATFNAASSTAGWSCAHGSVATTACNFTIVGGLAAGANTTVNYAVTVLDPPGVAQLSNTATIADDGTNGVDTNTANNSSTDVNTFVSDLTVTKTHAQTFMQGDSARTYTITVTNSGSGATSGAVTVIDNVPSDLIPVSATGTGWGASNDCSIVGQAVTCARSDALGSTQSYPAITLTVNVSQTAGTSVTNTAAVSGGGETDTGNNSASDLTNITPAPATHFLVTAPPSATANAPFTFTVTARNTFNNTAPSYTGTVHFTSSDVQGVLPADATLTNGVGTFTATLKTLGTQTITATDTVSAAITGTSGSIIVSAEVDSKSLDYHGDATSDLLWYNRTNGQIYMWAISGGVATSFSPIGAIADLNWQIQAGGDLNGDSRGDLIWRHRTTGQIYAWLMNGTSYSGAGVATVADADWQIVANADFNADGRGDLLWHHRTNGQIYIWFMDGTTATSAVSAGMLADVNWRIVAARDYNGDGRADILWHHRPTGQIYLWLMDGATTISTTPAGVLADANWQIVSGGDFNGDARADVLWYHRTTGEAYVWLMDGATSISKQSVGTIADLNWQISGSGDFNGDGRSDILWYQRTTGEAYIWLMNGATRIGTSPVGTVSDLNWGIQPLR